MPTYNWQYPNFGIDINATAVSNMYLAPNFFATYQVNEWTFGLGVFVPAGLGTEWNGDDLVQLSGGTSYEWMSRIGVVDIAPAVSYKFSDQFSLGLTFNIYYGFFELKRPNGVPSPAPPNTFSQFSEESSGTGFGVTVGAQYKINEMFALGATFRSKTTVTMSGEAEFPAFGLLGAPTKSDFDREVAFPLWIAGGLAVRPTDCWVITFDVQYSQWSKSEDVLVTEYKDPTWKAALEADDSHLFVLKWEDATQIRLGTEYLPSKDWALRLGCYYDPAPAPDETLNILFPSSTNHVITGGAGYQTGNWSFQVAAEYLFGEERIISDEMDAEGFVNEMPGKHQMDIFAWSVGFGYAW